MLRPANCGSRRDDSFPRRRKPLLEGRNSGTSVLRASSLLHLDLELDALSLDDDPPWLDLEHTERRDDVTFTNQPAIDDRLWRSAHDGRLQTQLTRLPRQVLHENLPLLPHIGSRAHRLCQLIPKSHGVFI